MSTQQEITRITTARNKLRSKGVELGICTATDKLDAVATKFDENLENQGGISATVKEGETITIPRGYHNGTGTVSGVPGGGNYTLQSKSVAPTEKQQAITPDAGYYGLSDVSIAPIPEQYKDVSGTTATPADVLVTKTFVQADGTLVPGEMPVNEPVAATINGFNVTSYAIPAGYHDGTGTVSLSDDIEKALAAI
ncbi:MAG: hypothetical protein NC209_03790 [Alistipes sp.]|nr:hypothetical protein [Lachnospiraceae bacterium]MCM1250253.1 hypothetical protein [Alistipes sp.]MCM1301898.1 hypothetical protein [Bacteroides cellulosilyticus]